MKNQKIFFMLAAAVALSAGVSSCTNDDRELQCADGRTPITLVSSVGGSRAADVNLQRTQIAAGVQTGVFVTNDARTVADNVPLTADGAGSFTGAKCITRKTGLPSAYMRMLPTTAVGWERWVLTILLP